MTAKRRLLTSLLPLAAATALFAQTDSDFQLPKNSLRLNVMAKNSPLTVKAANNAGESFSIGKTTWLKPEFHDKGAYICGQNDTSATWKQLNLTITTEQNDNVTISLMGTHINHSLSTLFDNINVEGQLVPNGGFEAGLAQWQIHPDTSKHPVIVTDPGLVYEGKASLRTTHDHTASFTVKTTAGKPTQVRLSYCVAPPPELPSYFHPIDLSAVVNRDFTDATPGDNAGGWTDQGPENDLAGFDVTRHVFQQIGFNLINPKENNNKAVAVFHSEHLPTQLKSFTVKVDRKAKFLYLLHTSAWNHYENNSETARAIVTDKAGNKKTFPIRIGQELLDWWLAADLANAKVVYRRPATQGNAGLFVSKFALPDTTIDTLTVETAGKGIYLLLAASVSDADVRINFDDVKPGKDFKPLDFINVNYEANSALDFSRFNIPNAVDKLGRVRISACGTFLEYEKFPGIPVRFRATYHFRPPQAHLSHEEKKAGIDRYVQNVSRAGYNMIRTHIIDCFAKGKNRNDYEFDTENIDLIDYFIYKCKQAGIYINYNTGAYQLSVKEMAFRPGFPNIKQLMMFGDQRVRKSWIEMTKYLLHRKNPYTGLTMAEDPILVLVEPFNELGLAFNIRSDRPQANEHVLKSFGDFLKQKYQGQQAPEPSLPPFTKNPQMAADWEEFRYHASREVKDFMVDTSRELGYTGPLAQYNCIKTLSYLALNEHKSDITIANTYFCHPNKIDKIGSITGQLNPFTELCSHLRSSTTMHAYNKPIIATEYNTSWGNQYKYASLMYPAYAALNGFSGLTRHETMNDLWVTKKADTFGSIIDRAFETMALFFFQRGDISPSKNKFILEIPEDYATRTRTAGFAVSSAQTRLALVSTFTVDVLRAGEPKPVTKLNEVRLPILGSADVTLHDWFVSQKDGTTLFDAQAFVQKLKDTGLLPKENLTNPNLGLWQSDTGELTLDAHANTFTVCTPKSEAVAGKANVTFELKTLKSFTSSVPGAFSIHSLQDELPLQQADQFLLIYATTVMNTDMARTYDYSRLVSNGKLPVLLQTGTINAKLQLKPQQSYTLYPLANNGVRRQPITLKADSQGIAELKLDTATLPNGPTFYFELVKN